MSFRAQFGPDEVLEVNANRSAALASPRNPDRLDFYVTAHLDPRMTVTLAGTRGELPAMRVLLRTMLDALDAIDPDQGDQDRISIGDQYDPRVTPPWHPTLNPATPPEGIESAEGGEAA